MILEDFVMLGTTVPEPKKDGRVFVCSAGVSAERKSLVRIYPLAKRNIPHRWDIHRVPVELNPQDQRSESYKIAGERGLEVHDGINQRFERTGTVKPSDRVGLLRPHVISGIAEANAKRLSLAVVHPDAIDLTFEHNPDSPDSPQLALFDRPGDPPSGARRFAFMPRVRFHDDGGWHHLMLRDWGTFELQRKNGESYFRQNLAGALHLDESSSLLVGNLNNQRNAWLVISVLNGVRDAPSLFDALADERPRVTDKVRLEVFSRDEWQCVKCGDPNELVVDHVWPHSKGGVGKVANYQTLCKACNLAKNDGTEAVA